MTVTSTTTKNLFMYVEKAFKSVSLAKKVYLIAVKPTISHETNNVKRNLKEGETANLTCNATGYPEPTITWYREKEGKRYGKENQNYLCIKH